MPLNNQRIDDNRWLFFDISRGDGGIELPLVDGAIDCTYIYF